MDLKICYYKDTIDSELDKKLTSFIKALGYEWYGQGYSFDEKEREIVFDLKK